MVLKTLWQKEKLTFVTMFWDFFSVIIPSFMEIFNIFYLMSSKLCAADLLYLGKISLKTDIAEISLQCGAYSLGYVEMQPQDMNAYPHYVQNLTFIKGHNSNITKLKQIPFPRHQAFPKAYMLVWHIS